ncbi:hypothetical protein N431DRAFT_432477 [Stipitochalara longipes BDJ]|nr:hypothetical protein N431DRAFT_432477 [Stipitochalara longipes BDJ]
MCLLEKLPTELLERVFLYCMNLELPRASPVISGKLSSEVVYLHTIITAFGPTWERWHGQPEQFRNFKEKGPTINLNGDFDGDPKLQSAILRCRWTTSSRLLGAKDTWIRRKGLGKAFKPRYFLTSINTSSGEDEGENDSPPELTAIEHFNNDFASFSEFVQQRDGGCIWGNCNWNTDKDVANGVEIPTGLLLGPWDEAKIKDLFWIVKSGGAVIDWLNSTSGEAALEGLKTAITTGDTRAIHLLEWYGLIEKLDIETLLWTFRNAGGEKIATANQILRLGFSNISSNLKNARKVQRLLSDMEDEAEQEGDQGKLDFVNQLKRSQTLSELY